MINEKDEELLRAASDLVIKSSDLVDESGFRLFFGSKMAAIAFVCWELIGKGLDDVLHRITISDIFACLMATGLSTTVLTGLGIGTVAAVGASAVVVGGGLAVAAVWRSYAAESEALMRDIAFIRRGFDRLSSSIAGEDVSETQRHSYVKGLMGLTRALSGIDRAGVFREFVPGVQYAWDAKTRLVKDMCTLAVELFDARPWDSNYVTRVGWPAFERGVEHAASTAGIKRQKVAVGARPAPGI